MGYSEPKSEEGTDLEHAEDVGTKIKIGLKRAKESGTHVGRPPAKISWERVEKLREAGIPYNVICKAVGVSEATLYKKRKATGRRIGRMSMGRMAMRVR